MAALVRDSLVRKLIIDLPAKLYSPDFIFEEIEKHLDVISEKNSLSVEENKKVLKILAKYVNVVDSNFYADRIKDAEKIIGKIDINDVPYIALALSFKNDGIWSEDKYLQKQKSVKIWTTKAIKEI
jgi:predicted nucleic acid-binding protein